MSVHGLVVNRWRRYGKDRLYVEHPDGSKVGWWDLVTDEGHPESEEDRAALTAAVLGWKTSDGSEATPVFEPEDEPAIVVDEGGAVESVAESLADPAPLAVPAPSAAAVAPERPWIDLATTTAGAEAREQAEAARNAAPVRSVLARVLGVHTDERAWRIGADGEEKVAAQLAKAAKKDGRWRFLHAIPVGNRGSDIDHLIIGPGGAFTVNTKHHPGAKIWVGGNTFMVNGHRQPYVRNARYEATRAAKLLTAACGFPVHVEGLIVTVNAADVTIKSQPDGVSVTWRKNVATWLLRHGDVHTPEVIEAIYDAARRSTTWA